MCNEGHASARAIRQPSDVQLVPRGQRRASHQRKTSEQRSLPTSSEPVLGPATPLRNGAGALAAAHETLRNGADPPGPSFLNARF